jgi:hypothetical protein
MSETIPAKRPVLIRLFWVYCGITILAGTCALFGGIVLIGVADVVDWDDEPEVFYVIGGILAIVSAIAIVLHAIPLFLKRKDSSWKIIHGLLIALAVFWGLFFTPFILFPVLLISWWGSKNVKEYFGVAIEPEFAPRGRRANWDDGWDEKWDRPRP